MMKKIAKVLNSMFNGNGHGNGVTEYNPMSRYNNDSALEDLGTSNSIEGAVPVIPDRELPKYTPCFGEDESESEDAKYRY